MVEKSQQSFRKKNAPLSFNKKVKRQLAMSMQLGNAHDSFKMVRDAKTKIIRPSDLEAELIKISGL